MSNTNNALVIENLKKTYKGGVEAVKSISLTVKQGDFFALLGPNGAGKSTMMKILTGYIPPTEGEAFVGGLDVQSEGIEVRKKVGYLPEHNPLYLEMYVKEYLLFIAGLYGTDKSAVPSIIEKVGLGPEKHKKLGQLSKGFRQRAGLAAALLHEPEVLILDEPTTGLDVNQLVEIRQLIKEAGQNKTVMLSTHIMQEVEYLCDRVIIINKGKIVADRSIADLQNLKPEAQYQVEFDKAFTKSELRKIAGISKIEESGSNRWLLEAKATVDMRAAIFQFAVENQAAVLEMQKQSLSLEDIFKELTN